MKKTFFDIRAYGAIAGDDQLNTEPIQAAIDACAVAGGGTVVVPSGMYVTGSLTLGSGVTLRLAAGATLRATDDMEAFPLLDDVYARHSGRRVVYQPFIFGIDLHDVVIEGEGTIDGNGAHWWRRFEAGELKHRRPRLIAFSNCRNVRIERITAINSAEWTINPVCCEHVTVNKVTILNPPDSPNTDGINPDSSRNVTITNCTIDGGDDCIAIKAGLERSLRPAGRAACEHITIANCTMRHGHGAVVIGSETTGSIRRVTVSDCIFDGTDRGIRIKSRRRRGGSIEDVHAHHITMRNVPAPFSINMLYNKNINKERRRKESGFVGNSAETPRLCNVHLHDITCHDVEYAIAFMYGLPDAPLENITLHNIIASVVANGRRGYPVMMKNLERVQGGGFIGRYIAQITLTDITVRGHSDPLFSFKDSSCVYIKDCTLTC
ncbi:MAG: glycoside hydrolase family 28 protein [Ardenticatenaceae bacterium]